MDRRGAAIGEKREVARIVAFLYGGFADEIAHMRGGDPMNAARGF